MVAYSCRFVSSMLIGFLHIVSFAYVRVGFLDCGGVCIRFAICCCCLCTLCSVCYCLFVSLRFCAGLHRLLLGSEATVVFVGVSCGEPGGNEQMAHSQIVVVIAFSLIFEIDVAIVLHRRPFGNVDFQCRFSIAVPHHLFLYVIVCFGLF